MVRTISRKLPKRCNICQENTTQSHPFLISPQRVILPDLAGWLLGMESGGAFSPLMAGLVIPDSFVGLMFDSDIPKESTGLGKDKM